MIESVLNRKGYSAKAKITLKSLISTGLIALAIVLPQVVHAIAGSSGGMKWLPMYFPVLIAGCLLGVKWGAAVGIMSPIASFLITSLFGNAMPIASRLPFMIAEIAVFAVIAGLFSKKISDNALWSVPAVILAIICGRATFMLLVIIFQSITSITPSLVFSQIKSGLVGAIAQIVLVPIIVMGLKFLLDREKKDA